ILDISSQMYGITYKPVTDAQAWHPEVTVYDVYDKNNRIGRIYFDMFPRENKYKHYATFSLATGKEGFRLPEYVLVCNFPRAADDFGRALNVRQQMFYAAVSLDFYNRDPKGLDQDKLVAQLQERYTPYKYVEGTHMHTAFGHLNGYSAVYYTYMWSLVIAKD